MSDPIARLNTVLAARYRVDRQIGEGGMATVYLARDLRHGRPVALKLLEPILLDLAGSERFVGEIRTTASLQHPHILPLFDSGDVDGVPFYVTPYVEGESLKDRLARDGRLGVEETVAIASDVAGALDYAHRHGVIHRDVKPGNILLSDDRPLVADFGIALALPDGGSERLTGTGRSLGTPGYMSPEQVTSARDVDHRTDVYSLGALTYEMLAGAAPFAAGSPQAALARALTEDAPDVRDVQPDVPKAIADAIRRAMSKSPEDRYESTEDFARVLRSALPGPSSVGWSRRARSVALLSSLAVVAAVGAWYTRGRASRWARVEATPEVQRLLESGEVGPAFALATRAAAVLPDDPTLADLLEAASAHLTLASDPPGAHVTYRLYTQDDTAWVELGTTPIEGAAVPNGELLLRLTHVGYRDRVVGVAPLLAPGSVALSTIDEEPPTVRVSATTNGLSGEEIALDTFWIDEHEVTNGDYRAFVEAGGYADAALWSRVFTAAEVGADLETVSTRFVDLTGRPGPAGWELSRPPPERSRYPVQGVSWFEAVAFCMHAGKSLPTYYHWKTADAGDRSPWDGVVQRANLGDGEGPVSVDSTWSYGIRGVKDMAGNVREWVWNAAGDDRYVLGGSWESLPHIYTSFDAGDPWDRDPQNGFRCARYASPPGERALAAIESPVFDFRKLDPPDEATYRSFARFYEYDRNPLHVTRQVVARTDDWTRELVEVDAAYLDERLPIHVFLPTNAEPPFQAVLYFPGASMTRLGSSRNLSEMSQLMFVPKSGRALLYPVLEGAYERRFERPSRGASEERQRYVWLTQDIMRTVDYVEEAEELDGARVAYFGMSLGAEFTPPAALEKRFRALVLVGGALDPAWWGTTPDAVAPWNFVHRITTPTLLVNGRHDFMHPYDEGQVPFFDAIDVPPEDKRFVVIESGHLPPNNQVIGLVLGWLDERLGPVSGARPGG